jgi:cytochrome c-type biogenesis protein CcmF
VIAHIGIACVVLGVAISNSFGIAHDAKLAPGEGAMLGKYKITFLKEKDLTGPNYHGMRATFVISNQKYSHKIYPEKRIYNVTKIAMTDSDIDVGIFRDIYIALGEPLGDKSWSVRMYYKPFIRFIWLGGFLVLLGGLLGFVGQIKILHKFKKVAANDSFIL